MTRRITERDIPVVVSEPALVVDVSDEALRGGTDETHDFERVEPDVMLAIPHDEVDSVAFALRSLATQYRDDTKHGPEGLAVLQKSADRLDAMAELLEEKAGDR